MTFTSQSHKYYNVACDADGVLLDFQNKFKAAAEHVTQRAISNSTRSYSLGHRFHLTSQELDRTWHYFNQMNLWQDLAPLDGAVDAIHRLHESGPFNIHIVTAIPAEFAESRKRNFEKLGLYPHEIHCMDHLNRQSKVPFIQKLSPIMFMDDRLEHLESSRSYCPILVHIDQRDEQLGSDGTPIDFKCHSLTEWIDNFLNHQEYWFAHVHKEQPSTPPKFKR